MDDLSLQSIPTSRPVHFLIGSEGAKAYATALVVGRVREQNSSARIVVLGDRCELNEALAVFRAGADGYLFEQISRDALIKSLDLVMLGVTVLPAAIMRVVGEEHEIVSQDNPAVTAEQTDVPASDYTARKLSHREMGIFRCLMHGEPNKTIARQFQ